MSATCKGCGKAIEWGQTADGKRIPLDPRAPVYRASHLVTTLIERDSEAKVTHFATCAKAGDFAASGRGTVDAVHFCARECLHVEFVSHGRVRVCKSIVVVSPNSPNYEEFQKLLDAQIICEGETLEQAVAAYIARRAKEEA